MHMPWILLKFHSGIFRLFRIAKNRKFCENVVTARAELIFTVYGNIFSLCVCNSAVFLLENKNYRPQGLFLLESSGHFVGIS